eukprot:gene5316-7087_t
MEKNVKFNEDGVEAEDKKARALQTGRYDRRAMRARLSIDDYISEQLAILYDTDDFGQLPELDIDEVMARSSETRASYLSELLKDAKCPEKVHTFCSELLDRVCNFESVHGDMYLLTFWPTEPHNAPFLTYATNNYLDAFGGYDIQIALHLRRATSDFLKDEYVKPSCLIKNYLDQSFHLPNPPSSTHIDLVNDRLNLIFAADQVSAHGIQISICHCTVFTHLYMSAFDFFVVIKRRW